MDTRHKSRNYNLLVLCGLLCRLLENAPADGWVSRREVLPWLEDLVGKEGLEELERRIFDCSEEGFCIFDRERDGKYRLASSRPPRLTPTGDEAGLLLWLLERGWGKLFLEPETQELLLGRLEAHRRGAPLPDFSRTAWKGFSRLADDMAGEELGRRYRLAARAMEQGKGLRCRYRFDGEEREVFFLPRAFSFSPLDGRWRVAGVDREGKAALLYLANLEGLSLEEWTGPGEAPEEPVERVEFLVREGKNALDRVSARFGDCEKEIRETGDPAYPYRMEVSFPAGQRRQAAGRLLTLGTGVKVLSEPMRGELLAMARSALALYGEGPGPQRKEEPRHGI